MRAAALLALVPVIATAACAPGQERPLLVDHHVHLESDEAHAFMVELADFIGQALPDEVRTSGGRNADDLVAAMDSVGVDRALALSVAYLFGFPDFDVEDERARVRAENVWVAEQVARYPERLVGACAVNPLSDYALDEVTWCADDPRLSVLKLHLANSDVDLRDPGDLDRLGEVFQLAAERGLPVVVHMRTRATDYGARDVEAFVREVLSRAPGLPVQVAHMAGWGGYDDATDEAMGAWVELFRSGRLDPAPYTFDLAAVPLSPALAEGDTTLARRIGEQNRRLAERIREVGTNRVLFGSDWATVPMERTLDGVREGLSLGEADIADILDNVGALVR